MLCTYKQNQIFLRQIFLFAKCMKFSLSSNWQILFFFFHPSLWRGGESWELAPKRRDKCRCNEVRSVLASNRQTQMPGWRVVALAFAGVAQATPRKGEGGKLSSIESIRNELRINQPNAAVFTLTLSHFLLSPPCPQSSLCSYSLANTKARERKMTAIRWTSSFKSKRLDIFIYI